MSSIHCSILHDEYKLGEYIMGTAERKQLEKNTRRKLILDSATDVFREKGFAGTTMEDIARRAHIAVGTIYLYFNSKADIHFGLTTPALDSLLKRLKRIVNNKQNEPDVKIRKLVYAVEDFYVQNRDAYYLITRNKAADYSNLSIEDNLKTLRQLMSSNLKYLESVIEEGILKGLYKKRNPYSMAVLFWSSFIGIIQYQENRTALQKKDRRKIMIELFIEIMLAGLKN
jgi:AcrR family transcriptional regulator